MECPLTEKGFNDSICEIHRLVDDNDIAMTYLTRVWSERDADLFRRLRTTGGFWSRNPAGINY